MTQIVLKASERTETGSAAARRLRRQGLVPCVVLGQDRETRHVSVPAHDLELAIRRHARVVDLESPEGTERVLVKDLQYDTYGDAVQHVDFLRVVQGETIQTEVPIELFGTPKGVTEGNGVLDTELSVLRIECEPSEIPTAIEVDVRGLDVGAMVRVKDLTLPAGVVALNKPDRVVLSISEPAEEEEEGEVPESAAEPEVIRGKAEDGEDED